MLLVAFKKTDIFLTRWKRDSSLAFFHVVFKLSFIQCLICVPELAKPLHYILVPHTFVPSTVRPLISALAIERIIMKLSVIEIAIWKMKLAF